MFKGLSLNLRIGEENMRRWLLAASFAVAMLALPTSARADYYDFYFGPGYYFFENTADDGSYYNEYFTDDYYGDGSMVGYYDSYYYNGMTGQDNFYDLYTYSDGYYYWEQTYYTPESYQVVYDQFGDYYWVSYNSYQIQDSNGYYYYYDYDGLGNVYTNG